MIFLDNTTKEPYYYQIYTQIKADILWGACPVGTKLPSTRKLAKDLGIGRNTVESAYLQLTLEGYVTAKRGSGYIVNSFEGITLKAPDGKIPIRGRQISILGEACAGAAKKTEVSRHEENFKYDFQYIGMMGEAFPYSRPIPSLQSMDVNNRTIYAGTFSKCLSPGMRVAYLVLPLPLCEKFRQIFRNYRCTVPLLYQYTLAGFIRDKRFEQHLNRRRTLSRKRYEKLIAAIKRHFGDRAEIIGENAGIHILLRIHGATSQQALIEQAAAAGIRVYPTDVYYQENTAAPQDTVLLGFGNLKEAEIENAVALLAAAWQRQDEADLILKWACSGDKYAAQRKRRTY